MNVFFLNDIFQINAQTVDRVFASGRIDHSISERYTISTYELERTTINAGTYALSIPASAASAKQAVLFAIANAECELEITTRDYGDTADQTLTTILNTYEPTFISMHNIKAAFVTVTQATVFESMIAKVVSTSTAPSGSINFGIEPGSLPVGGIIAISGTFASTGPLAGYSEVGIIPLPSYLQQCDGSICSDTDSIFYGKYLPNLTGDKTLFGSATAGSETTSSTSATVLTGFGVDWNVFNQIDVAAAYTVRYFMRIK